MKELNAKREAAKRKRELLAEKAREEVERKNEQESHKGLTKVNYLLRDPLTSRKANCDVSDPYA